MADATRGRIQEDRDGHVDGGGETSHHPETDAQRKDEHYYGIPPIKKAHWTWEIFAYFWIGG